MTHITFRLSSAQLGITVSIALWGTVLGAIVSGLLGEKLGGRGALRMMALMWCRLSVLAIGLLPPHRRNRYRDSFGPVYIAEIAPSKWRGSGVCSRLSGVGILLAYASNFGLASLNGSALWRYQLGVAAIRH